MVWGVSTLKYIRAEILKILMASQDNQFDQKIIAKTDG